MSLLNETSIRLACFTFILLVMMLWETLSPRRAPSVVRSWRWASNLSLVAINSIVVRLIVPLTAVGLAEIADDEGWGVLHRVGWPLWVEVALAVVAFDLAIYLQHVVFHAVPLLWRLHMVHHADLTFDVTTGVRFHTFEIALSALIKLGVVLVLGPPAMAVILFEVLLNATSMFNHSNVRIPLWLDRVLRCVIVTPDMHRVHHSVIRRETNSNFGFNLSCWDFLFGTYRDQPAAGHKQMTIGLSSPRSEVQVERLPGMIALPFRSFTTDGDDV